MKRIIASLFIAATGLSAFAQGEFDALKYNQTDINGTARYISMAGAFGALGGDPSAILVNPAGLGVYRSSEFSVTSGLVYNKANSTWNGKSGNESNYDYAWNNLSYIINFGGNNGSKSGLVNSNFAISFNKLKNFNRSIYVKGGSQSTSMTDYIAGFTNGLSKSDVHYTSSYEPYNNTSVPYLSPLTEYAGLIDTVSGNNTKWSSFLNTGEKVTPSYSLTEKGYLNEWDFAYAANISNKVYIGASIGLQDLNYSATSKYSESFEQGGSFTLENNFKTTGSGVNFNLGAIFRPSNIVRLGLAVHTPTYFYDLTDTYDAQITSSQSSETSRTTVSTSTYELDGPLKANASAAFILGKKGILSLDYEFTGYSSMTLRDDNGSSSAFENANQGISSYLQDTHTFKVGGEFKLTDNFALRAGYALRTPATKNDALKLLEWNTTRTDPEFFLDKNTNYYSLGFGFRGDSWFFDFAYQLKDYNQEYYAFTTTTDSSNSTSRYAYVTSSDGLIKSATVNTKTSSYIATIGFKF